MVVAGLLRVSNPKFVVTLKDMGTARGPGTTKAVITDARDIGVSSYANEGGEAFFTLPWNHPQISEAQPWLRHYEIKRYNRNTSAYDVVGVGVLDDYEATANEVVFYGRDYLSLIDMSISSANTSYTDKDLGTIVQNVVTQVIDIGGATATPPLNFVTVGTIETTAQTATLLTSYQAQLQFCQQIIDIWQSDSSVRPILSITRTSPYTVSFQKNAGSDKNDRRFSFGGLINDFRYSPGYSSFLTRVNAIGQKREGATLLFSQAVYANEQSYGILNGSAVFFDIVNQAALDRKTKRAARRAGTIGKQLGMILRSEGVGPWEWGELADSIPVTISRGIVAVDGLYTVWGQEWIGKMDGSEDLFLSILPKET